MFILILSEALMYSVLVIELLYSDFSNLQYRKILVGMTGTITVGCWHELRYNMFKVSVFSSFCIYGEQFLWLQYYIHQSFYILLLLLLFTHSFIQRLSLVHTHSAFVSSPHTYFTLLFHF
jgi:hypothetical protein